jgi:hypothetical protein
MFSQRVIESSPTPLVEEMAQQPRLAAPLFGCAAQ